MIYVKIMSGEDMPDGNSSKGFQVFECESCTFRRVDVLGGKHAVVDMQITEKNGEEAIATTLSVTLTGNAYVLNEAGRTIASFAYSECRSN